MCIDFFFWYNVYRLLAISIYFSEISSANAQFGKKAFVIRQP